MKTKIGDIDLAPKVKVDEKKTEMFLRGVGFGLVYMFIVIGVGSILKYDSKIIGFTLITCGVYGLFIKWLESNNFFIKKREKSRKKNEK